MTWNILTGGRDRDGTDRWDRIVAVVAAQRPDVLALQELRGLDRDGRMKELAGRLGMTPHLARSWLGQPVAVLVRAPLRVLRSGRVRRPFHHATAQVQVATGAGPLTVFSTHLNPHSGGRRRMEADWLAVAVRAVRGAAGPARRGPEHPRPERRPHRAAGRPAHPLPAAAPASGRSYRRHPRGVPPARRRPGRPLAVCRWRRARRRRRP
ncbi:endonuclease/exonuclease/phosphatase family protein [Micromonospora eburnea]|uniref:endonuclease/exonuclease/phosphatase family protein n=1 Tax=Micromonospora eburnea TaxID=227316 RepID=UPI003133A547